MIFKTLLSVLICMSPSIEIAATNNADYLTQETDASPEALETKTYICPEQIVVSNDGIFIFDNTSWLRVSQINCDMHGIYYRSERVDKITDKCPNGHKMWCGRCGGCVVRWCKFRCRCVEWE